VSDLENRLCVRIKKSGELLQQVEEKSEAMRRLQKEKLELAQGLLIRQEELNNAKEDVSILCEASVSRQQKLTCSDYSWTKSVKRSLSFAARSRNWRWALDAKSESSKT